MNKITRNTFQLLKKAQKIFYTLFSKKFSTSENYWKYRYKDGGNSGPGSYNKLAQFKAEIINHFVIKNNIKSVIEFGFGDGNQLKLSNYKQYLGFDISPDAIKLCKEIFKNDLTKNFKLLKDYNDDEKAELVISLDVIFHLIEDDVFEQHMQNLFKASEKYIIIYSSNKNVISHEFKHVKHRKFIDWIDKNETNWKMKEFIPNKYPFNGNSQESSFSDFYIFEK